MDYAMKFTVNGRVNQFDVQSFNFKRGKDECLFNDKLFTNEQLRKDGYLVTDFPANWHTAIQNAVHGFIANQLARVSHVYPTGMKLENYHEFVDDHVHKEVVKSFRGGAFGLGGIHLSKLGIPHTDLDKFVNDTIGSNLSSHYKRYGLSLKHFWIRIVRPNSGDNNPPHKDIHVGWNKDSVNIYLPLAGSSELSSLPLLPGSHIENEKNYIISDSPCWVNNKKFVVPSVVHRDGGIDMITPNPQQNQILIFASQILHGGGINYSLDKTRISLEMRFFK